MPVSVTVVIPVWGAYADGRLDAALASIRDQDVPASIVLVDNAHPAGVKRPGTRVVRTERRLPLGTARNAGLAAVVTPLVVFWDADDVMLPGTLARLIAELESDPHLVACGASIIDGRTHERHHWPRRWPLSLAVHRRLFATLNAVSSLYGVTGAVIRTRAAADARFPGVDGGDDWVLGVSLAFRGRIHVCEEPGRLYRRHADSISSGWVLRSRLTHARLVRERLRTDPAVPRPVRRLVPAIALAQWATLGVLRPIGRLTPRRRRERA